MFILPAIDIVDKKAVRLFKGDYKQMTVYSNDPCSVAQKFMESGAEYIHLVDLEGARDGGTPNFDVVSDIISSTGLKAEVGGGIRSDETVERYIEAGVCRVVLGTAALNDPAFLERMVKRFGDKIAVGVDCRDGFVAIRGWTETSTVSCRDFMKKLEDLGVKTVICTDISKDGAMSGTNRELYRELNRDFDINIIASGGVSSMEDVVALGEMGMYGAIIGKAYYVGAIDLAEAIEAAK